MGVFMLGWVDRDNPVRVQKNFVAFAHNLQIWQLVLESKPSTGISQSVGAFFIGHQKSISHADTGGNIPLFLSRGKLSGTP